MQNVAQHFFLSIIQTWWQTLKCNMGSKMEHVKHKFWMITERSDGWFCVQQWSCSESPARNTVLLETKVWRLLLTHPVVRPPCMLPHNFLLSVSGSICWDISCSHQLVASVLKRLHCWPVIVLLAFLKMPLSPYLHFVYAADMPSLPPPPPPHHACLRVII